MGTAATWPRNVAPMLAAKKAKDDAGKTAKAIDQLVELGWVRSITEHGLTLTEPRRDGAVKTNANG